MKVNALLDVNVVAHESEAEVSVLVEFQAPPAPVDTERPCASFEVVLDRSGSMSGAPLSGAKKALVGLVRRLEPTDNFGLVAFDDAAQVVVPAGPLIDKERVISLIEAVEPGGMTDLSAGYLRGLREIRRVAGSTGGTVLVISDGHVNSGLTDVTEFASITAKAYGDGVVTSTLGYGQGYDETLLSQIARAGSGNHVFADDPDAAGAAIAGEVEGLLSKVSQAVSLTVRLEPAVEVAHLYNDLPCLQLSDRAVMIELGDLYADEARKLLLTFRVPAMAALGAARVATLELTHVELPGLVEHLVTLPISVNVVPGDEAAGRLPLPSVRSEILFQEAQDAKRRASEAFERGDVDAGAALLDETKATLQAALDVAPAGTVDEVRAELEDVDRLSAMTEQASSNYLSKVSRDSYHQQNRKRGRTHPPVEPS